MERRQIDLFGIDQFIVRNCPQIFDVVDQKGVRWRMMGEKDDLSASSGQFFNHFGTDARSASLEDL